MRWSVLPVVIVLLASCGDSAESPSSVVSGGVTDWIDLPPPDLTGETPLEETLTSRRSIRQYSRQPLAMEDISQLLWATQGVTSDAGQRTAPSAGGLYPLEVYLVTPSGWYHYDPEQHRLEVMGADDRRASLSVAALSQSAVADAAGVFVIAAVYARTEGKYGRRAERYVHLEAGHAAQNLLLQAVALDLGAVPIGAFDDAAVREVLGSPEDHAPLYLIPVGHPAGG